MTEKNENINTILIFIAIVFGFLLLVGLVYRPVLLLVLVLAAVVLLFGGGYFFYKTVKSTNDHKDEDLKNVEEGIAGQLSLCKQEIAKNYKENQGINKDIFDLEGTLDSTDILDTRNRQESKRILAGFYRELELRKAKLDFYETCKTKLDTLLYNHEFSKTLHEKQGKLNELQEDHYEDLAKMEALRSDMSYNMKFLETIETLSLRMLDSTSLDSAKQLALELKEITKELRRL